MSQKPADPRFGDLVQVDRLAIGFGEVVAFDALDRAGELVHLGAGRPLFCWISRRRPSTVNGVTGSGIRNRSRPPALGPERRFQIAAADEREPSSHRRPTRSRHAAAAVLLLQRDLGPDLGEVGVDIALIDHLGAVDLAEANRNVAGGFGWPSAALIGDQPGPLGVDHGRLAVRVEPRDRDPLIVDLSTWKPGLIEVEDLVQLGDQPAGGGLDFEDQLAVLGLPLVERLGDLELLERPDGALGRGRVDRDRRATRRAGPRSPRCP